MTEMNFGAAKPGEPTAFAFDNPRKIKETFTGCAFRKGAKKICFSVGERRDAKVWLENHALSISRSEFDNFVAPLNSGMNRLRFDRPITIRVVKFDARQIFTNYLNHQFHNSTSQLTFRPEAKSNT